MALVGFDGRKNPRPMLAIEVFDNVTRPLATVLRERLAAAQSASMAVAFLRQSGLSALERSLLRFLERGGVAECIFGFDYMFTEPEALVHMVELSGAYLGFHFFAYGTSLSADGGAYHPKLYVFRERELTHAIVGSSNLTRGGLRSNVEANVLISGGSDNAAIVQAEGLYRYVRNRESVFVPDPDYLEKYAQLYRASRAASRAATREAAVSRLRAELEEHESALPGTVPTQKELIVEAIRHLRRDREQFISLRQVTEWLEEEARRRGIHYKWDTLHNSIRGRFNQHTLGKGGDDLFERMGGVAGRHGRYRLTERAERFRMRSTVEELR